MRKPFTNCGMKRGQRRGRVAVVTAVATRQQLRVAGRAARTPPHGHPRTHLKVVDRAVAVRVEVFQELVGLHLGDGLADHVRQAAQAAVELLARDDAVAILVKELEGAAQLLPVLVELEDDLLHDGALPRHLFVIVEARSLGDPHARAQKRHGLADHL